VAATPWWTHQVQGRWTSPDTLSSNMTHTTGARPLQGGKGAAPTRGCTHQLSCMQQQHGLHHSVPHAHWRKPGCMHRASTMAARATCREGSVARTTRTAAWRRSAARRLATPLPRVASRAMVSAPSLRAPHTTGVGCSLKLSARQWCCKRGAKSRRGRHGTGARTDTTARTHARAQWVHSSPVPIPRSHPLARLVVCDGVAAWRFKSTLCLFMDFPQRPPFQPHHARVCGHFACVAVLPALPLTYCRLPVPP
jgi:hypothetical protein